MVKLGASFRRAAGWKRGHVYAVHPCCPPLRRGERTAVTLRRWFVGKPRMRYHATRVTSEPSFGRGSPDRTPGKMDKPLQLPDLEPGRDRKSPLRRCFELRHPLRAGPPVRLRLLVRSLGVGGVLLTLDDWRFSGLLSGDPPTSTQPQARANMGRAVYRDIRQAMQVRLARACSKLREENRSKQRAPRPMSSGCHTAMV